jgi:hypothetical protein
MGLAQDHVQLRTLVVMVSVGFCCCSGRSASNCIECKQCQSGMSIEFSFSHSIIAPYENADVILNLKWD